MNLRNFLIESQIKEIIVIFEDLLITLNHMEYFIDDLSDDKFRDLLFSLIKYFK